MPPTGRRREHARRSARRIFLIVSTLVSGIHAVELEPSEGSSESILPPGPLPRLRLELPFASAGSTTFAATSSTDITSPAPLLHGSVDAPRNVPTAPNAPPPAPQEDPSAQDPLPEPDDRSWWARWNSSLIGASISVNLFEGLMVASFTRLPTDVSGWHEPQFTGFKKNFSEGPRVDNDRFFFNYIAHPLSGSEYYLIGRNRGLNWWQGFLYSAAMSTFFEFFIEATYEQASWQDLWITPVAGTVVGELRWQAKKALENPYTGKPEGAWRKILYVVLDPFDPLFNL